MPIAPHRSAGSALRLSVTDPERLQLDHAIGSLGQTHSLLTLDGGRTWGAPGSRRTDGRRWPTAFGPTAGALAGGVSDGLCKGVTSTLSR